jgi:hypothetical protein
VRSLRAEQLLHFPVRLDGMDVGRAVDLILDPGHGRALGLDVLCRDDVHRFLPLAAAVVDGTEIRLSTPFALVDDAGFEFYRGRTTSLRTLKGSQVARSGEDLGALLDVVLSPQGEIEAFVVGSGDGARKVRVEPDISVVANAHNGSR